jgi:DNA-binding NarL/FixJ family response regulator
MSSIRAHGAACVGVPKTCFRCGVNFIDFSDRGAARVCAECKKPRAPAPQPSAALLGQPLTHRQVQIADLIARGVTNKNIAHELHLNEGTIKVFVSIVLAKTGQPNRTALAVWWALGHR